MTISYIHLVELLRSEEIENLRNKLTIYEIVPEKIKKIRKKLIAYREKNGEIEFPRHIYSNILISHGEQVNFQYNPIENNRKWTGPELYDYQEEAMDKISFYFSDVNISNGSSHIFLKMPTGSGKTITGVMVSMRFSKKVLVVVPSKLIKNQWLTTFENYTDMIPEEDFQVIVINTARNFTDLSQRFDLIILDEANEYCSSMNHKIVWEANSVEKVLALSATPLGRIDGLDRFVLLFYGAPIELDYMDKNVFKGMVFPIVYNKVNDNGFTTRPNIMNELKDILYEQERIDMVISIVSILYRDGRHIFVFSEFREYLDVVKQKLYEIIPHDDIIDDFVQVLKGGVSNEEIEKARINPRIILTTFGYGRRGISFTEMDTIVFASPRRNNLMQILGRIERKGSDENIKRIVVDIIDSCSFVKHQFKTRKTVYEEKKYTMLKSIRWDHNPNSIEILMNSCVHHHNL